MSDPSSLGVSTSAMSTLVGRLPSMTRWATSASGTPSARTSSAVLPKASAWAWAKTLDERMSWCSPRGLRLLAKQIRSSGTIVVPWWMSW